MLSSPWSSLVASRAGGRVPGWEGCARAGRKGRRAGGSDEGADLHVDKGLTQTARLVVPFPPRSELLSTGDQEPKPFSFVPLPCQKFNPLEFQATVQRARVFGGRTYTLE